MLHPSRAELRAQLLEQRQALSPNQVIQDSAAACEHLLKSDVFQSASTIASYLATNNELDMALALDDCHKKNKPVFLPMISDFKRKMMDFRQYLPDDTLHKNRYGIAEPTVEAELWSPAKNDVILVPLVACDLAGNRLGMGGGFYDRFLEQRADSLVKIGIAYDWQVLDSVPTEAWDIPVDYVLTPSGLWGTRR